LSFADFLALQPSPAAEQDQSDDVRPDDMRSDDARFEAEFAELSAFFDTVKTDDFDAMQYLSPIANAVRTVTAEKVTFAEAISRHCSQRSADKILAAFNETAREKLILLISGMHDEI
ncbi:MAG: hypothetical protein J6Y57_06750, partial [Lachnospiraceae bacterium]|nr:hypothetical protein [Lachnospiraceae bacterium]